MSQRFKERTVDLVWVVLVAAVLIGGYWLFQRMRYHDALDRALLQLIQDQQKAVAKPPAVPH